MIEQIYIPSVSIILQKSTGEVLLCKRSKDVSFFPTFWVFPGGKIEEEIPDTWEGTEIEVIDTILKEMYEEIGLVAGSNDIIPPKDRSKPFFNQPYDTHKRNNFFENMIFVGKKQTPPFRPKCYDAAYFWIKNETIDFLDPIVDGSELTQLEWILPQEAIEDWENRKKRIPPPILHLLRNLSQDYFAEKTLVETSLPVGLQTKVEFAPGYQLIPISSDTIPPFSNTNLVIIEDTNEYLIVDPGANEISYRHFKQILLSLPRTPSVFITHHHRDHWRGLDVVEEIYPDAILYINPETLKRINTNLEPKTAVDGNIIVGKKTLKIITSPGHTDTHQVLFDEVAKVLIAGDHVVGYGSAVLDPSYGNMKSYFETTKMLIDLKPNLILPAHGPPNFTGVKLLNYYIKHRTEREEAIFSAWMDGNRSLEQIVGLVYQDVPDSMWEFAKRNIQLHLDKLKEENRISE